MGDNTATTWRDLAGQLNLDDISVLEQIESQSYDEVNLLRVAHSWAKANARQHNIALPADANEVEEWDFTDDDRRLTRWFRGTCRGAVVPVDIVGAQDYNGEVRSRVILVGKEHIDIDAATAYRVAADLLDAADELKQLEERGKRRPRTA
jgi:hypothetical protein